MLAHEDKSTEGRAPFFHPITPFTDTSHFAIIPQQILHSSLSPTYLLLNYEFTIEMRYLWA